MTETESEDKGRALQSSRAHQSNRNCPSIRVVPGVFSTVVLRKISSRPRSARTKGAARFWQFSLGNKVLVLVSPCSFSRPFSGGWRCQISAFCPLPIVITISYRPREQILLCCNSSFYRCVLPPCPAVQHFEMRPDVTARSEVT